MYGGSVAGIGPDMVQVPFVDPNQMIQYVENSICTFQYLTSWETQKKLIWYHIGNISVTSGIKIPVVRIKNLSQELFFFNSRNMYIVNYS